MAATPRVERSHERGKKRGLLFWIALALLVHLELGVGLGLLLYFVAPRDADLKAQLASAGGDAGLEIGLMSEDEARKILAEYEQEQERRKQEEIRKEQESPKAPGQVVELPRPTNEQRPDEARFVAEFDAKVDKQTRKYGELNPRAVMGRADGRDAITTPAMPERAAQAARPATPAGRTASPSPVLAMRTPPGARSPRPPGLGPEELAGQSPDSEPGGPPGDGRDLAVGTASPREPAGGGAPQSALPGAEALLPTPQQVARSIGSGTQDHLDGIDEGDETALNAKNWKFASFFNRVKRQVRNHWRPAEEYRKHDPTFRIYGQRDRFTLLRVTLKPDGTLANVALEQPSGVEFLDDEAIEAFKQAQPFPNPPQKLIEDGMISFRFGFYFEIGGGLPSFKVFRYNDF